MDAVIIMTVATAVVLLFTLIRVMLVGGKSKFGVPYFVQNYVSHYVTDQRKSDYSI